MPDLSVTTVQKIASTTAPLWKTLLWWTLGIGAVVTLVTLLIVMVSKKLSTSEAVEYVLGFTRAQVKQAEVNAQVEVAKADGVAEDKISEIKKALQHDDEFERAKALAALR
jgi:hypothetical protein